MHHHGFVVALALLGAGAGFATAASSSAKAVPPPGRTPFDVRAAAAARAAAPTILWGPGAARPPKALAGQDPVAAGRAHLLANARSYGLTETDVINAVVQHVHDTGRGAVIVTFGQRVNGLDVFGERTSVVMDRRLGLVAITGSIGPSWTAPSLVAPAFVLRPDDAVARAVQDLAGVDLSGSLAAPAVKAAGEYVHVASVARPDAAAPLLAPARTRAVWFRLPDGHVPAYTVEVVVRRSDAPAPDRFAYVVRADDGRVLVRHDQTAPYSFRAWADPAGLPYDGPYGNGLMPSSGAPIPAVFAAKNTVTPPPADPWLPAAATQTVGNNVDAWADVSAWAGHQPEDVSPGPDADGCFGCAPDTDATAAGVVHMFYTINFLHDWYYAAGFDEAAGNAQTNNYGRGGLGGDALRAIAVGRGSASYTPADGTPPEVFIGQYDGRTGTYDTQVIAHEVGHVMAGRLVGDGWGLYNKTGRGLAEGWADFQALLLTVRAEDAGSDGAFRGAFALAGYAAQDLRFGFRRYPYSIDAGVNPLTYRHIANGEALPQGAPVNPVPAALENAERHNAGEVWATMLWQCYAAMLARDGAAGVPFTATQERMKRYLVESLKATPVYPTLLEARDAVLAVVRAGDDAAHDYPLFAQAFARRGAGVLAKSPDRYSVDNAGLVESFVPATALALQDAVVDDAARGDGDGILDSGEPATLKITFRNLGIDVLPASAVSVTSSDPGVFLPTAPTSVPAVAAAADVVVHVPIAVLVTGKQVIRLAITEGGTTEIVPLLVHADRQASTLPNLAEWTPGGNPAPGASRGWTLDGAAAPPFWHVTDYEETTDQWLVSPAIFVGSDPFTLRFVHRHEFESYGVNENYDGGVIEVTALDAGGAEEGWRDVGVATAGYTGTLLEASPDPPHPLALRRAYTGTTAGFESRAWVPMSVPLPPGYVGRWVKVRFRSGTDYSSGAYGWDVAQVAYDQYVDETDAYADTDEDGVAVQDDCAFWDATVWAAPSPVDSLHLSGRDTTALTWSAPASPGGTALRYDVLRSPDPRGFAAAACVASGLAATTATDGQAAAPLSAYLVRVRNACGAQLGQGSDGLPRTGAACP